jgi:HSP20 family protein
MAVIRWEPFRDLANLQHRMNQAFDASYQGQQGAEDRAWAPAVDIFEENGNIILKAELPGIEPKDVDVRVENNVLTLKGERHFDGEVKREDYHRVERTYGAFSRSFTLPTVVDTDKIKAEVKDGLLRLTLPKKEEAKPKHISVNVAK